mmetsp:Transcript_15332/g.22600  ORF Transcript_15332/g.22600 Transcript_15332/m.22600 type:complete len:1118 (-) Transcript_15332:82-3435(-)
MNQSSQRLISPHPPPMMHRVAMKVNAFLAFFFFVSFQLPFGANSASTAIYQDNFFEPHSAIQRKLHERDLQETGRAAHFTSVPAAPPSLFSSRQQRYSTKSGRQHHRRADNQVPTFSPTPLVSCSGGDVPFKLLFTADGSKGDLTADDDEGETIFSLDAGDSSYGDAFAFEHSKGKEEYQECLQADECYVLSIKNDGSSGFSSSYSVHFDGAKVVSGGGSEYFDQHFIGEACASANRQEILDKEREVLIKLFETTGGENWHNNTGWIVEEDICEWFGVECIGFRTALNLTSNGLVGTIPTEVGLSSLFEFRLSGNNLTGTIPSEIGLLSDLTRLNLSANRLIGTIPEGIMMIKLENLDLSHNRLTNSLLHQGNLQSLRYLDVSYNDLTSFPFSEFWNTLETIDLRYNQIRQDLLVDYTGLSSLKDLFLSHNSFSGSIPKSIGSLPRVENIYLDHNDLIGTIPDDLVGLTRLMELKLSHNRQERLCVSEFECDTTVESYSDGDTVCCEGGNGQTICTDRVEIGSVDELCLCPGLGGEIPANFRNTPYLLLLDLSNNYLVGTIPPEIGELFRLEVLDLTNNTLTGTIPPILGKLVDTSVFLQGNNMIGGKNGNKLSPLSLCINVPGFDLSDDPTRCPPERNVLAKLFESTDGPEWNFSDEWFEEFNNHCDWTGIECNQEKSVVKVMLSNNGLSGRIPDAIAGLKSLEMVDFSDNDLRGTIPNGFGTLSNLSSFIVSYNELTGSIPSGFSFMSELELFHIHDNRFQGTVSFLHKGKNASSFIADCGRPSDFETPVSCPNCTMCCNERLECEIAETTSFVRPLGIYAAGVLLFSLLLVIASLLWRKAFPESKLSASDKSDAIGTASVYSFFFSRNPIAWLLAILVLITQASCYWIFVDRAMLDFEDDEVEFIYRFVCPRNSLDCRFTSDVTHIGWFFFVVILAIFLLADLVNGIKLVWSASSHGISRKTFQVLIGGVSLSLITAFALFSSVVFNISISRSSVELIFNTVILLFVTELDERLFDILDVISHHWLKKITSEIETDFGARNGSEDDTDLKSKVQELERKLAQKEEEIAQLNVNIGNLREDMTGQYADLKSFVERVIGVDDHPLQDNPLRTVKKA